jgi:hypothetical protein
MKPKTPAKLVEHLLDSDPVDRLALKVGQKIWLNDIEDLPREEVTITALHPDAVEYVDANGEEGTTAPEHIEGWQGPDEPDWPQEVKSPEGHPPGSYHPDTDPAAFDDE